MYKMVYLVNNDAIEESLRILQHFIPTCKPQQDNICEIMNMWAPDLQVPVDHVSLWMQVVQRRHDLCPVEARSVLRENPIPWQVEEELQEGMNAGTLLL